MLAQIPKLLFLTLFSLLFQFAEAQYKYQIEGKLRVESGDIRGAKIEVIKNGTLQDSKPLGKSGKFDFELDYNADYIFAFTKEGYVTKKLSFNTNAPDDRIRNGFYPFEFEIGLFRQFEGINTVIFNQPVGQIKYSKEIGDFDYDKDYTQSILSQMQKVEEEVRKREKKEKKNIKKELATKEEKEEPKEIVKKEEVAPARTPSVETKKPKKGNEYSQIANLNSGNRVVLQAYTAGQFKFPNVSAYGYINFGDGGGIREITKEQYDQYAKNYR